MRNPLATASIFLWVILISPLFLPVTGLFAAAEETGIATTEGKTVDIEKLIAELSHKDPEVRVMAVRQLGSLGLNARQAMPALSTLLEDSDPAVRDSAIYALAQMGPEAIPFLLPALKFERYEGHWKGMPPVISAFFDFGQAAVPVLVESLQSDDVNMRGNAALILGEIWAEGRNSGSETPDARAVVQALIGVLNNDGEDVFVLYQAVAALGKIGPPAKAAIAVLTKLLFSHRSDKYPVSTSSPIDQFLYSSSLESELGYAIAWIGDPETAAPFIEALGAESPDTRILAAAVLEQMMRKYPVDSAIPVLLNKLEDPYAQVRHYAILALSTQDTLKNHLPVLSGLLKSDNAEARKAAVSVLENMGPDAIEAAPLLAGLLKSEDEELRVASARALLCIDRQNNRAAALRVLFDALSSSDRPAADVARNFLLWSGRRNITDIIDFLNTESPADRLQAAEILSKTNSDISAAVPALVSALLHDKDPALQGFVIEALRKEQTNLFAKDQEPGPDQQNIIQALIQALVMDDDNTQMQAAAMLNDIGPRARDAVPALMEVLKDNNKDVRLYALSALGSIGPDAEAAVPTLLALLTPDNFDTEIADRAIYALIGIGKNPEEVVPVLLGLLNQDPLLVYRVMSALKEYGAQAAAAVPALNEIFLCRAPESSYVGSLQIVPEKPAANPCPYSKETAAQALLEIDPQIAPALIGAFRKIWSERGPRQGLVFETNYGLAADILLLIGDQRGDPIPALVQGLSHEEKFVRDEAGRVLIAMGSEAAQAMPLLIDMLDNENPAVKNRAARVLATIVDVTTLPESVKNKIPDKYWNAYHDNLMRWR